MKCHSFRSMALEIADHARLLELDAVTANLSGEKKLTPELLEQWLVERHQFSSRITGMER